MNLFSHKIFDYQQIYKIKYKKLITSKNNFILLSLLIIQLILIPYQFFFHHKNFSLIFLIKFYWEYIQIYQSYLNSF